MPKRGPSTDGSSDRIATILERYPQLSAAVNDCFRQRFSVPISECGPDFAALRAVVERDAESEDARTVFNTLADAVVATLRTNKIE